MYNSLTDVSVICICDNAYVFLTSFLVSEMILLSSQMYVCILFSLSNYPTLLYMWQCGTYTYANRLQIHYMVYLNPALPNVQQREIIQHTYHLETLYLVYLFPVLPHEQQCGSSTYVLYCSFSHFARPQTYIVASQVDLQNILVCHI